MGSFLNDKKALMIVVWLKSRYPNIEDDELDRLVQQIFDLAQFIVRRWLNEQDQDAAAIKNRKNDGHSGSP